MRRARTARRGVAGTALAAVLLAGATTALVAAPASAHNVVVGTSPGHDETVTSAPDEVSVTFDDVVLNVSADGSSTAIQVTDAQGDEHATGCPTTQDRTIAVPVALDDPGEYTVAWRAVSADGHPTSGEFTFTYAPAQGADAGRSDGAASPPAGCDRGADGASDDASDAGDPQAGQGSDQAARTTAAGEDAATGGSDDLLVVLGIAGGVVVLAGAGVLVALRLSRRG